MNQYFIYALGFLAQSLFGARSIVQWYLSEREGKVVSPTLFWVFSLSGSSLFLLYGLIRQDIVILIGQSISFYIYIRNLQLKRVWSGIPLFFQLLFVAIPPSILLLWFQQESTFAFKADLSFTFMFVGIAGQLLLNCRYLYQWYFSEKANESVLPLGFWIISLAASVMVVVYSIARQEPVLLVAQSLGIVVYLRNIIIYSRSTPKGQSRINNTG
jgi:lipid-A-disaccharide synthase-like uncharacterized protein